MICINCCQKIPQRSLERNCSGKERNHCSLSLSHFMSASEGEGFILVLKLKEVVKFNKVYC